MNRLSWSQANKFMTCPKSYEYHYIKKYRSKYQKAALLFGTAIDVATTSMMKTPDKDPVEVFNYFWKWQEVNGKKTHLPDCIEIVYADSDYDEELLEDRDVLELKSKLKLNDPLNDVKEIYKVKKNIGFKNLSDVQKETLNYANWLCLNRKGLLMIKAVKDKVVPQITSMLAAQVQVNLKNEEGDTILGYADLVCKWKGYDKPIVMDFKTSSKKYEKDSVILSPQLTLYVHDLSEQYENTRLAGFIVLDKKIRKNKIKHCSVCEFNGTGTRYVTCPNIIEDVRCDSEWVEKIFPEVNVDVIIDEIPEQTDLIVLENMDHINQNIKNKIFYRNLQSCNMSWGKCEFFSKCYKDSEEDIIKVGESK